MSSSNSGVDSSVIRRNTYIDSLLSSTKVFFLEFPNKIFWLSTICTVCISIVIAQIFRIYSPSSKSFFLTIDYETGNQPIFIIFFGGLLTITLYFIYCLKKKFMLEKNVLFRMSSLKTPMKQPEWTKKSTLFVIRRRIESVIIDAFEAQCIRENAIDHKSRRTIALQRASQHIKDSYRSFDLISQCQLEGMARHSTFISLLFYIRNHYLWTIFIHCVIIAHVSLSFLESKTKRTNDHWIINGTKFYISMNLSEAVPEFCLLFVEYFDILLKIAWIHLCPTHVLRPRYERFYAYLHFLVITYIAIDLVVNLSTHMSLEFLIPVRPLLLILMNHYLRREVATLAHSIYDMLPVLRLYFLVVLFCGIIALILFGDMQHSTSYLYTLSNASDAQSDFLEFLDMFWYSFRSILTMFVFVSSGENYTSVVYPAIQLFNGWILLFFVPIIFLGIFTMMAMITGIFEDIFVKREVINRRRDLWWKRTGIIAAFLLLDENNDHLLSVNEFTAFVTFIRTDVDRKKAYVLFKKLDVDGSGAIDLQEFVDGIEILSIHRLFNPLKTLQFNTDVSDKHANSPELRSAPLKANPILSLFSCACNCRSEKSEPNFMESFLIWRETLERIWLSWIADKVRIFCLIFNFWLFCWINIIEEESVIIIADVFLFIHTFDVLFKMFIMYPPRYFKFTDYHDDFYIEEFGNRADFLIICLSVIGTISGWIWFGGIFFADHHYMQVFSALVLLRVFILWKTSLRFLFMIKAASSSLVSLFVVMFCVFFAYGVIGVSLFKEKTALFGDQQSYMANGRGDANFDTLGHAMITLIQGLTGESFHEIMMATKDVSDSRDWSICFYIISYFLIMTLLFGNLYFGLLLSVFGSLYSIIIDSDSDGKRFTSYELRKVQSSLGIIDDSESSVSDWDDHHMDMNTVMDGAVGEKQMMMDSNGGRHRSSIPRQSLNIISETSHTKSNAMRKGSMTLEEERDEEIPSFLKSYLTDTMVIEEEKETQTKFNVSVEMTEF